MARRSFATPSLVLARVPRPVRAALAAGLLLLAGAASAQTWEYRSYLRDKLSGQYSKDHYQTATLELKVQSDTQGTFRLVAPRLDPCYRSPLPALLERSAETLTITVTEVLAGCEPFRYVIRNDGSGGVKQVRRDGSWHDDGYDHGLTPVK